MLRVMVVDDQAMVREGFGALLDAQPGMEVVGTAADGAAAVRTALALAHEGRRPDVILMDVRMPVRSGIEATADVVAEATLTGTMVLVLTTFDLDDYVYAALRAGASGFLLKHAPASELVRAVRVVAAGEQLLDADLTRRLISHYLETRDAAQVDGAQHEHLAALTAKEVEVLELVARGLSNQELARRLFIAEQTAKSHVSRIFTKLSLRDRAQAVAFAYECGLVRPGA
ncbi:response regulator [Pseudokineococcus sp. 1T1Z-3]|uniref:response regulator n=1 Tax=Pseudokineococcus sp. 1T1Z-3 TaxID=3132745 RepID=UPI00403F5240